ncbi:hypothetical protein [Bacillus thuringiensis]|uniref:hypothetical protein n=1 Tax=Bacillus thuringiensis TaxID=1428 RepID=UPI0021D6554B|nr:hypothetical protein [Bacillus thuringiensis]MCU7667417.1 hypothetical protein [Bacillus thuringiensis]
MSAKEEFIFDSKEPQKAIASFRNQLKKENKKMRISKETYSYSDEHRMSIKIYNGFSEINFFISRVTDHIMGLKFGYSNYKRYDSGMIVEFAMDLANTIGSSTIIIQGNSLEEQLKIQPKELKRSENDKDRDKVEWLFVNSLNGSEKIFYVNLEEDYVENKLAINRLVDEQLEKYAAEDKTFVSTKRAGCKDYLIVTYYYKGFEGKIEIIFGKRTEFHVSELNIKKEIQSPSEIVALFDDVMEESHNNIKLMSLINPPKKHFRAFFTQTIKNNAQLSDDVFTLISEDVPAEQIEEDILDNKKHEYKSYSTYNEYRFFKIFNLYLILDEREKTAEKFYDFEKAQEACLEKTRKREHDDYITRLYHAEQRILSINP